MSSDRIIVRGAREHNLKNVDVELPRDQLIVITGLSGSGKSSLAFDTIFAEGQRRYVESLSAYARQFLGQMDKPDVDYIEGLSPAISIDQKGVSHNPRSTVGTVTEIYDYLRLLFARVGHPHCPQCGRPIQQQTVEQMVDAILGLPNGTRIMLLAPIIRDRKGEHHHVFEDIRKSGYVRARVDGRLYDVNEDVELERHKKHTIEVVVDRLVVRAHETDDGRGDRAAGPQDDGNASANGFIGTGLSANGATAATDVSAQRASSGVRQPSAVMDHPDRARIADSVESALKLGGGVLTVAIVDGEELLFSEHFACVHCGISLGEIEPRTFSFNSPQGACPSCTGLGTTLEIDPDLVLPNRELSLAEGAIQPWSKATGGSGYYAQLLESVARHFDFTMTTSVKELKPEQLDAVLYGTGKERLKLRYEDRQQRRREYETTFEGVIPNLQRRYKESESDAVRLDIERYMASRPCPVCRGSRLKPESHAVTIAGKSIVAVTRQSIVEALRWFQTLDDDLSDRERTIARQVLKEIRSRLGFLVDVGLDYLTLDRTAGTLSGGEAQR
ncbi:MAG: excinuclease ABC subunit UvrA, partial [Chloroflexi bacterium]|nr:excinuclease ABC subunit UvrA [Chloroflexota bacterium]